MVRRFRNEKSPLRQSKLGTAKCSATASSGFPDERSGTRTFALQSLANLRTFACRQLLPTLPQPFAFSRLHRAKAAKAIANVLLQSARELLEFLIALLNLAALHFVRQCSRAGERGIELQIPQHLEIVSGRAAVHVFRRERRAFTAGRHQAHRRD